MATQRHGFSAVVHAKHGGKLHPTTGHRVDADDSPLPGGYQRGPKKKLFSPGPSAEEIRAKKPM